MVKGPDDFYWGRRLLENVDVFSALLGPSVDTRPCVSSRDSWKISSEVFLRPLVSGSRLFDCSCLRSTGTPFFWELIDFPKCRIQRFLVRQWIHALRQSTELFEEAHTVYEGFCTNFLLFLRGLLGSCDRFSSCSPWCSFSRC